MTRITLLNSTLFIGQGYIDVTLTGGGIPTGDEKILADDYAVSFGGNAVTAGFCCSHLGTPVDLLSTSADDWLGRMFDDMARKYHVVLHKRMVPRFAVSSVHPNNGKRAIKRGRDDRYQEDFPDIDLTRCRIVHIDGLQNDAALYYTKLARRGDILTSFDCGSVREHMDELLRYTDIAVGSLRLCEQTDRDVGQQLAHFRRRGCYIGAITLGERGMVWYEGGGKERIMPALAVPSERIVDTTGAGDIFHGAYVHYAVTRPSSSWESRFKFARAASAHAIQFLGNEASLPSMEDVALALSTYKESIVRVS